MTNTPQPTAPKSATITTEEALKLARAELLNITTAAWDDITYEDFYRWARNRAQFTLSATAPDKVAAHVAQQVPDGWQIVPKEPTAEMQAAGTTACTFEATLLNRMFVTNRSYRAMLAAAPQEPK